MSTHAPLPPLAACRVAVMSADPAVRDALAALIAVHEDLTAAEDGMADVAVVDGLDALRALAKIPGAPPAVALLEGVPGPQALAEGARGVLPRDTRPERLVAALLGVRAGLTVMDVELSEAAIPAGEPEAPGAPLTRREQEVVRLLAEGRSNKEIAAHLGISPHTAKFHVNGILSKLQVTTRTEAVVRAAQRGWLLI